MIYAYLLQENFSFQSTLESVINSKTFKKTIKTQEFICFDPLQFFIIHFHNTCMIIKAVIAAFLLATSFCLKFVIQVNRQDGAKCFYQALTLNQKYFFQVISRTHQNYRIDVMRSDGSRWEEVTVKMANGIVESISKYATRDGTYMFCLSTSDDHILRAQIEVMTGIEMGNLEYLPSNTDQENLHKEIDWLETQKQKIFDTINRHQSSGTTTEDISSKMSLKYVILAIVGLASVIAVNVALYLETKKTLKDRKLI